MDRAKGYIKKYHYYVFAFIMLAVLISVLASTYIKGIKAEDSAYKVADEVVINGKTYTSTNKMQVLMIVPDRAYDEIGVLIGDDMGSIKYNDIKKLAPKTVKDDMTTYGSEDNNYKSLLSSYQDFLNNGIISNTKYRIVYKMPNGKTYEQFSSFWQASELGGSWSNLELCVQEKKSDGSWVNVPYRNIFAAIIFDNYNMDNKMDFSIKKAADIDMEDIKKADLVYISSKSHNNAAIPVYNKLTGQNVSAGITYSKKSNDLDADEALYLMECYAKGDKRVILDTTVRDDNNKDTNIRKIGYLFTAIDPDVYISDFVKVKDKNNCYSYGDKGCIRIIDNSIRMFYKQTTDKEIKFQADMFINGGNNFAVQSNDANENASRHEDYLAGYPVNAQDKYPYYNATANGKGTFVNPYLYVFNGNNSMTSGMTNDTISMSDYTTDWAGNVNYNGSTYEAALEATGVLDSNGKKVLHPSDAIEYILGVYNSNSISSIKVLEIEPAGFSRYNDEAGKMAIASWFGLTSEQYKKIAPYITVDCYSMNGFNGLNADIRSEYDVVIIGAYDSKEYNTDIYTTPYDSEMQIDNYKLTGNDITDKAYEKLYSYVKAGMPLVLDEGVYYNLDSVVSSDCEKLYKVSINNLKKRLLGEASSNAGTNIVHINTRGSEGYKTISKTIKYVAKPSVSIAPFINGSRIADYKQTGVNNDTITASASVNNKDLSQVHFKGNIEGSGSYRVKIYVDRNNDSVFAEDYSSEKSELIYFAKNAGAAVTDSEGKVLGAEINSNSFDIELPLPTSLKGYIKWRVEVTDVKTGAVKNSDGAFAVSSGSSVRTIKVLQVENDDEAAHIDLHGDAFTKTFDRTTKVTGLAVDILTIKKSELNKQIEKNADYLSNFSMLVLGFSDNYGNDVKKSSKNFSEKTVNAIEAYIEAGNSVLFTHDSMSYKKGSSNDTATDISQVNKFTSVLKEKIGMKGGLEFTDVLKLKLASYNDSEGKTQYYTIFNNVSASGNTRVTNKVKQLNSGQITEYPYTLSGNNVMTVNDTHAQYYELDLEERKDLEDVVVWYTLDVSSSDSSSKYFESTGQDALNNYYAYSVGNITYTSAGHSNIKNEGDEMKLFVNTFVRALLAGNNVPEVEYDNAEKVDDSTYAIYYRQRPDTTSLIVDYTVTDDDIVVNVGQVKESYIYYDKDEDGVYTEGTDVFIGYLDKDGNVFATKPDGGVYSGKPYSLTIWEGSSTCSSAINDKVLSEMKDKMANGTLCIGITAMDSSKAVGNASLQIAYRPLFNLN